MGDYRLYCRDNDGRFIASHDFEAEHDEAALAKARGMRFLVRCELWQQGRMVAAIEPYGAQIPTGPTLTGP